MENAIVILDPLLKNVENIILWRNRVVSLVALILIQSVIYVCSRFSPRLFCRLFLGVLVFHFIDYLLYSCKVMHRRRKSNSLCQLSQHLLNISESYLWELHTRLDFLIVAVIIFLIGIIDLPTCKTAHVLFLLLFTLPVLFDRGVPHRLLVFISPMLQQLDRAMEYKRKSVVDPDELLVNYRLPSQDDDDELPLFDSDKPKDDSSLPYEEENSMKSFSFSSASYESSMTESEILGDGRKRIKMKGSRVKVKGLKKRIPLKKLNWEPDMTSFDFLDEYEDS